MAVDDLRTGTWVTYAGGRAAGMRVRRCRLEVVAGPDAGVIRDIEASVIRIGARRGNDLQLQDTKVSGLHCEIRLDERGYRLIDLDSTNGTWVSGMRVNDVYVAPGAQIAVGGSKLRFQLFTPGRVRIQLVLHDRRRHTVHHHLDQLLATGLDPFDLTLGGREPRAVLHPEAVHLARELLTKLVEEILA